MTMTHSSIDLMLLQEQADSPAFADEVVRKYHDYIYRLSLSILNDPADASDATQEALIDALFHIDRYRIGTNFRAWLSRIAVNKCYAILRKQKLQRKVRDAIRFKFLKDSSPANVLDTISENEKVRQLNLAIENLSSKHRVAIVLRYVHELSIKEIAEILGVREGTIHSRLHYAIRNLQKMMED
jgi:RNA polymerase sigma-70 factor (ECF subfamily)